MDATHKPGQPDVPMLVRDARVGGFVRVNQSFTEQLGYSAEDLVDQPLLEWIRPRERARFQKALDRGDGTLEGRHRARQGGWVAFEWQVSSAAQGPVVLGVLQGGDSLPSKPRRTLTKQPRGTMAEILEAMALVIEDQHPGMKCSVLLLDDESHRVSVGAGPSLPDDYNQAIEGLLIGPSVGSCGTAAYWNQRIIVSDIQKDPLWKELREVAARAGVGACWSHPIRAGDGAVLGATALYNTEPRVPTQQELDGLETAARMFGLAIERGRAEQREAVMEQQLHHAAKMEALGVLAGGLAHDFNNMLATVMGNAELAMTKLPAEGAAYRMLGEIVTASSGASELCNQMLAYAGRGMLSTHRLECNGLIKEFCGLLQVTLSKKATIEYELSEERLFVEGDKAQLGQVLMNLVTNAAEALGDGAGRILVATDGRLYDAEELKEFQPDGELAAGEYVRLSVADTGCGMTEETQATIFDPFFTTKFAGRGLGLAAVQGIVRRHGGAIGVESELGRGTTFLVLLPLAAPPKVDADSPTEEKAELRTSKRVLIVDDEPQVRKIFGLILESAGFEVVQARNGQEAIEIFERERDAIDCVLLDLSMPELDGEETFRRLQRIQHDVRVVLASGFTEQEILDRFDGSGLAGVLSKPAGRDDLIAKIQEVASPE